MRPSQISFVLIERISDWPRVLAHLSHHHTTTSVCVFDKHNGINVIANIAGKMTVYTTSYRGACFAAQDAGSRLEIVNINLCNRLPQVTPVTVSPYVSGAYWR